MQTGPDGEYKTSWTEVTAPAQRLIAEKAGFERGTGAPLKLNFFSPRRYIENVVRALREEPLPILEFTHGRRKKLHKITPVVGLISVSELYSTPEDREGIYFFQNPKIHSSLYLAALSILVNSANRKLLIEQFDPIPLPQQLFKNTQDDIEEADSA